MIASRWTLLIKTGVSDEFAEKIKTHVLYSKNYFQKIVSLWDNVEKYDTAGQTTDHKQYGACTLHAG